MRSGANTDEELVALWLSGRPESTVRVYAHTVQDFLKSLPSPLPITTVADIIAWTESLSGAPITRARKVYTIKSLLSFAHKTGYIQFNVGAVLQCPTAPNTLHERIIEEPEVLALIKSATSCPRDLALVRLLYVSGCRLAEALTLRFKDVHRAGRVTVTGKGNRTRTILVPESLVQDLLNLKRAMDHSGSPVFKSHRSSLPLDPRDGREIIYKAAKKAQLEKVSPHWLRHAHASHALDNGAPIHLVQQSLGHASVATTSRYLHARKKDGSSRFLSPEAY